MGYALRLVEPAPLLEDLAVLGMEVVVSAAEGEVVFCVHVPNVSEDLQKAWREFLVSYAKALKAKHGDLPIAVENGGLGRAARADGLNLSIFIAFAFLFSRAPGRWQRSASAWR